MKKLTIILSIIACLAYSCIQELDADITAIEPVLVVNCLFNQEQPFLLHVSKSYSPLDSTDNTLIANALVRIYENEVLLGELTYKPIYFLRESGAIDILDTSTTENKTVYGYAYTNRDIIPKNGHAYKVEVIADGFPTVTAKSFVPEKVEIRELVRDSLFFNKMAPTLSYAYYTLKFNDPPINNHYLFVINAYSMSRVYYDPNIINIIVQSPDKNIHKGYRDNENIVLFSDALFNGNEYSLQFSLSYSFLFESTAPVVVHPSILNLSTDLELFVKSVLFNRAAKDNPLSEPVSIYTNTDNGLGIFAGYSLSKHPIKINYPTKEDYKK